MNINDIMDSDFREAERHAKENGLELLGINGVSARNLRRKFDKPGLSVVAIIVWVAVALSMLACAYTLGYWKATNDDLDRQREQEREWAEQDARIAAEVRAMSNTDLIAATERDAAKYKKTK